MNRSARRLCRPLGALACAMFVAGLDACGGGGSAPPVNGGGPVFTTESARLLAEFVARDSNNQFIRVWDPAHPDVAIQNIRITVSNGIIWTSSHLVFSDATRYDPSSHTVTALGHARAFYDNDGKLYTIDLRGGQSHVPVQLSSAIDVVLPVRVFNMSADGVDAWLDVQGGDARLLPSARRWRRRTRPSLVLKINGALRDPASGLPQYFLASYSVRSGHRPDADETFQVKSIPRSTAVQAEPTVATMGNRDGWLGADPAQPGLGYRSYRRHGAHCPLGGQRRHGGRAGPVRLLPTDSTR